MIDILHLASLVFQVAILGLCVVAVRQRSVPAVVNNVGALVLAAVPALLGISAPVLLGQSLRIDPLLTLWLAVAGFLHSLGMLGLYDSTWWWDHLTHTVSAALVAALLYAALPVAYPSLPEAVPWPGAFETATIAFAFAIGVCWELIELLAREAGERFDIDPVLVHYGWRDTALDLVFDLVGALLVVGLDVRVFDSIVEQYPAVTGLLLAGSAWLVGGGSLAMALLVGVASANRS